MSCVFESINLICCLSNATFNFTLKSFWMKPWAHINRCSIRANVKSIDRWITRTACECVAVGIISLAWQLNSSWKRAIMKLLAKRGWNSDNDSEKQFHCARTKAALSLFQSQLRIYLFSNRTPGILFEKKNWCSYLFAHICLWSRANVSTPRVCVVRK